MSIIELVLISIGLAMDAFAVSICKGLSVKKVLPKHALSVGLYFGGFQALMPLIGFLLGSGFKSYIENIDHWIAFTLLVLIGANMVKEAFGEDEKQNDSFSVKTMMLLAIATSIDALAIGVSFAMIGDINIWVAITLIGVITCVISCIGIYIGNLFGSRYKSKAELAGGIILILIGIKILLEHLGVLNI